MEIMTLPNPLDQNVNITYDQNTETWVAEGFLISTKKTLPTLTARNGAQISKKTGHDRVKTFLNTHFIIDEHLLKKGKDSHFYGYGKDALLEGYAKKSHGTIYDTPGPYYYDKDGKEKNGDYWYNFRMRLSSGKAASALIENGKKTWTKFAVSPHIWDYPELNQPDDNIEMWDGVGVALVLKGAYGNEAIISKLCKGDDKSCFGPIGIGNAILKECNANCHCEICEKEEDNLSKIITSLLGKASSIPLDKMSDNNPAKDNPSDMKDIPVTETQKTNPTTEPQKGLTDSPKNPLPEQQIQGSEVISAQELKMLREKAESVTEMENERRIELLSDMFKIIPDDKERSKVITEYSKEELKKVKEMKVFLERFAPYIKEQYKAELETLSKGEDTGNKRGKASSMLPPETKPEKKDDSGKEKGKASATIPKLQFRNLIQGRMR